MPYILKFDLRQINFLLKLIHESKAYEKQTGSKIQQLLYFSKWQKK